MRNCEIARVEIRPEPVAHQSGNMIFILEAGNGIVGLRFEPDFRNAAGAHGLEHRQPPAVQEIVHQRGDEHRLARPREAGDAETQGRVDEAGRPVGQRVEGDAGIVGKAGQERRQGSRNPAKSKHFQQKR